MPISEQISINRPISAERRRALARDRRRKRKFTPHDPLKRPPAGLYDPAIDAEDDAARRGFGYAQEDATRDEGRSMEDLSIARGDIERTRTRQLGDIDRGFKTLGINQTMSARRAGVDQGGGAILSQQVRAANQGRENQQVFDEYGNPAAAGDYGHAGRELDLSFTRNTTDRNTGLSRSLTERDAFSAAAQESRFAQAKQVDPNWKAPTRPKNEFFNPQTGQKYQLRRSTSGRVVKVLPNGRVVKRTNTTTLN